MKFAVLVFPPGYHALKHVVGVETLFVWHKEESLAGFDGVVIPGRLSRTGTTCGAARSPGFRPS